MRAGAIAACVWAAVEPLDRLLLRHDYSDVAVLGKAFTRGRGWALLGLALHTANGAVFGLAYHETARRVRIDQRRLALGMALGEHLALFPLGHLVDRHHPARGEAGLAPIFHPRAFAQETWRHAVFGLVLGRLSAR